DVLQIEVQFGIGFESALKVFSQGGFTAYLSIRDTQKLLGNRRDQFDSFIIVADDRFQIMSIPSCNPILGQSPNLVCHLPRISTLSYMERQWKLCNCGFEL